ncbi:MAG TPA: xanthine dehydrogenase family protein molybdopterin-binding subunit [Thermodesulfobacteriota bacterium]|nr:xanthine dehydrogenase family protein molybdopterin-binding subunit [Thermodesulfobacteriota bacterium]
MINKPISRRSFLKITGLTIAVSATPFGYSVINASAQKEGSFNPNVWFEITPNNKITMTMGPSEMGQGTHTALGMVIADELEADWKQVRIVQGPASEAFKNPAMGDQITVASASVRGFYEPLRKAGAAGKTMLVKAAAQTWKVPEEECIALNGTVKHKKSNRSLTYGQLCLTAAKLDLPKDPPLKKEAEFRYIGKSMARVDIPDKVSGKAIYGLDVKVPEMLYGVIARPPAYGAKPVSFDQKAAEGVKGVRNVFPTPMGIIVCAQSLDAAWKGRNALKAQWDKGALPQMDNNFIEKTFMDELEKAGAEAIKVGDAKKALGEAAKKVEATYFVPFVAHATMEPMNCTAHVQKDRCDVWAPTQAQLVFRMLASQFAEVPPEKVQIHTTLLGCGLGRRAAPDFMIEAVVASKVSGKPVKLVWTREEDIKYDFFRAATCQKIQAGLDGQGRLIGWSHKAIAGSIMKDIDPKGIINGVDIMSLWGILDFPGAPTNNKIMYEIPNFYVEFLISSLPIPVAPWRSVQNGPNAFVIECFTDEVANAAGKDPLEFRLQHLKNNMRPRRVLETVAEKAGWGKPLPKGKGRGIAQHCCFGSYVAQVAEVSVNQGNGAVKVDRIVAAVDCGPVVNPDTIKAQIEGAVIEALSTTLKEEIMFSNGGVKSNNLDDYKIIRMSEIPEIEVHIIKSNEPIGGIGEPGVPPTAPAVANAVFNATGARIRRIPLTPQTVLAAIQKK